MSTYFQTGLLSYANPWAYGKQRDVPVHPLTDADLSYVERATGVVTDTFSLVGNVPSLATGAVKNKLKGLAQDAVVATSAQVAHPLLEKAFAVLKELSDLIASNCNLSPEKRKAIAGTIRTLLAQESVALKTSVASNNTIAWFSRADRANLRNLCQALESPKPFTSAYTPLVTQAFEIVHTRRNLQLGPVATVIESAIEQLRRSLGITTTGAAATSSVLETENQDLFAERLAARAPRPTRPDNILAVIEEQAALVKSNVTKMLLGQFVLFSVCGMKDTDQVTRLIDSANQIQKTTGQDSDRAFKQAIYDQIDKSDRSWLGKKWAKFVYWFCESPFRFYVNGAVDNIKRDALVFIGKGKEERLQEMIDVLINPTNNYLTLVTSFYETLGKSTEVKTQDPDDDLKEFIYKTQVNKKKAEGLNDEITSIIMKKYIPSLGWSPYAIFQPLINRILRRTISTVALPSILKSSKSSIGVGGSYLHLINKFIYEKLCEIKDDLKNHKELPDTTDLSLLSKAPFERLIEAVFGVLDHQRASNGNISNLTKKVTSTGLVAESAQMIDDALLLAVRDTAKKQVIGLAQSFTERELLEDLLLTSLSSLNETFTPNAKPTVEQMKETEENMFKALNELITVAVTGAVEDQLHPSERIQREADAYVNRLKKKVAAFDLFVQANPTITELKTAHDKLLREVEDLQKKAKAGTNDSTMVVVNGFQRQFLEFSAEVSRRVRELTTLEAQRAKAAKTDFAMAQLQILLQTTKSNEQLLRNLQGLAVTDYPLSVQGSLASLKASIRDSITPDEHKARCLDIVIDELAENKKALATLEQTIRTERPLVLTSLAPLTTWAQGLQHFVCTGENSTLLTMAGAVVGPGLKAILVGRIMGITQELFKFVGKEYNWDGLGLRIVDAFLKMPSRSKEKDDEILAKLNGT